MKTPIQYQHELDQALIDEAGKPSVDKLMALESSLQMDLRALQFQFMGRSTSQIGRTSNKGGRERAEGEKRLEDEKTARLKPYEELLEKVKESIQALAK